MISKSANVLRSYSTRKLSSIGVADCVNWALLNKTELKRRRRIYSSDWTHGWCGTMCKL